MSTSARRDLDGPLAKGEARRPRIPWHPTRANWIAVIFMNALLLACLVTLVIVLVLR